MASRSLTPIDELLGDLAAAPSLKGAICVADPEAWMIHGGPAGDRMARRAVRRCRKCPALAACTAWLDALPTNRRPRGTVTAAQVIPPGRGG